MTAKVRKLQGRVIDIEKKRQFITDEKAINGRNAYLKLSSLTFEAYTR